MGQLRVGQDGPPPTLVLAHKRGPAAVAGLEVAVDGVIREVRLAADEPLEVAAAFVRMLRVPVEYAVPAPVPRKGGGGLCPEPVRVFFGGSDECAYLRVDRLHGRLPAGALELSREPDPSKLMPR